MTATHSYPEPQDVTGRHSVERLVMRPWTHLDLFSGIGGFALAARWTGWETIGFSEIDPYACKVLEKHWPGVPNYGDVRTVPALQCDLITGGFPCQPFSCAGKRRGAADDRHLWPAMLAVIERCRPAWVLGENVPGIIGMVLHDVLSDLATLDYQSQVFVVPACAVDARHRRDRVWVVAHATRERCTQSWAGVEIREVYHGHRDEASAKRAVGRWNGTEMGRAFGGISRGSWRSNWQPEPNIRRVVDGLPNQLDRLKGLGNAIVPQVAAVFMDAIARAHNH